MHIQRSPTRILQYPPACPCVRTNLDQSFSAIPKYRVAALGKSLLGRLIFCRSYPVFQFQATISPTETAEIHSGTAVFLAKIAHRKSKTAWPLDCYNGSRHKKQTLSQNYTTLRGFTPDFKRSKAVFHINTFIVVELDVLVHKLSHLLAGYRFATVQAFSFESTEKVFH